MLTEFYKLIGDEGDVILWWQMCLRAVIVFVWAVALYRAMPRRAFGSNAALDIVIVVVLGSSLSRALTGNAPVVPTIAATAVLAILYGLLNYMALRFDWVSRALKGRRLRLIKDGELDRRALDRGQLGEGDLMENIRASGLSSVKEVESAWLERNGKVTVIKKS